MKHSLSPAIFVIASCLVHGGVLAQDVVPPPPEAPTVEDDASNEVVLPRDVVPSPDADLNVATGLVVDPDAAVTPGHISLHEVLASAAEHHPRVRAALAGERAAESELLAARGAFDPQLDVIGKLRTGAYYELRRLDAEIRQPTPLWGAEVYAGYRLGLGVYEDHYPSYYSDETLDQGEVRAGVRIPLWRDGRLDSRRAGRL